MYKILLCVRNADNNSLWQPYWKEITTVITNDDDTITEISEFKEYSTNDIVELEIEIQELLKMYSSVAIRPYTDLTCKIIVDISTKENTVQEEIVGDNNGLEQTNT